MPEEQADRQTRVPAMTDARLVRTAISRSNETWLSAEAIAVATRLPSETVQAVLDTSRHGFIERPPESGGGPVRYSTREHYRATTGLLRRYFDAVVSS